MNKGMHVLLIEIKNGRVSNDVSHAVINNIFNAMVCIFSLMSHPGPILFLGTQFKLKILRKKKVCRRMEKLKMKHFVPF